jgi:hypothetical protein
MCRVLQEEPSDPRGSLGDEMYLCVALFHNVISYERAWGAYMPEGQRVASQNGQRRSKEVTDHGHGQLDWRLAGSYQPPRISSLLSRADMASNAGR